MKDNAFWYGIWKLVAICFCVLVGSLSGCVINSQYTVARAIKDGADPIKASCAISSCSVETRLALGLRRD